jgi:hypothetical protein
MLLMTMRRIIFHVTTCIILLTDVCDSRKTDLQITNDPRSAFLVEPFCFDDSGKLDLRVANFVQRQNDATLAQPVGVGFLVRKTDNPQAAYNPAAVTEILSGCLLSKDLMLVGDQRVMMQTSDLNYSLSLEDQGPGLYTVIYANCAEGTETSFNLQMTLTNKGGQMLSAGNIPLPICFAIFTVAFGVALVVWVVVIVQNRESAHRIHVLMAVLCGVKVLQQAATLCVYYVVPHLIFNVNWAAYHIACGVLWCSVVSIWLHITSVEKKYICCPTYPLPPFTTPTPPKLLHCQIGTPPCSMRTALTDA